MKEKSESEVAQSCLTLSDPMDCSLPGSSVHGFSRQEYWSGVPLPSPANMSTYTHSHIHTHTHTHSHMFILKLMYTCILTYSNIACTHTCTQLHTQTFARSHAHSYKDMCSVASERRLLCGLLRAAYVRELAC